MIPLRWTYAGDAGKRLASDGHFILPTPSVPDRLKKNEKKQADFDNLGLKLQARRAITRPAMKQARQQKADDKGAAKKPSDTPLQDAMYNNMSPEAIYNMTQDAIYNKTAEMFQEGVKGVAKDFTHRIGQNPYVQAARRNPYVMAAQAAGVNLGPLR